MIKVINSLILMGIFMMVGCNHNKPELTVDFLKISDCSIVDNKFHLSGYSKHSSLGVREIQIHEVPDGKQVIVYLTDAPFPLDGNIDFSIKLRDKDRFVYLGTSKQVILKRADATK